MPVLRDRTGTIPETWTRLAAAGDVPDGAWVLLPWAEGFAAPAGVLPGRLGLEVPNTVAPGALVPLFPRLGLIAVGFPAFSDGRGFSVGAKLRALGWRGRLRAVGPVIADQFPHLLGSGFDEVETPDALDRRQPQPQWDAALAAVSLSYQSGRPGRTGILEARRAARAGA